MTTGHALGMQYVFFAEIKSAPGEARLFEN
jgi:hypothetical protein